MQSPRTSPDQLSQTLWGWDRAIWVVTISQVSLSPPELGDEAVSEAWGALQSELHHLWPDNALQCPEGSHAPYFMPPVPPKGQGERARLPDWHRGGVQ